MTRVRISPSGPSVEVAAFPPGDYVGQTVGWNGEAWVPSLLLEIPEINGHGTPPFGSPDLAVRAKDGGNLTLESTGGSVAVQAGDTGVTCNSAGAEVRTTCSDDTAQQWRFTSGEMRFRAFDNDPPVARPTVEGETTDALVGSLIDALAALGWVVDGRIT